MKKSVESVPSKHETLTQFVTAYLESKQLQHFGFDSDSVYVWLYTTVLLSQKTVTTYLKSKQLLSFDTARQLCKTKRQYLPIAFWLCNVGLKSWNSVTAYLSK